ncbi:hypothetical protein [Sphingomonas bacterium]|uniref:hypothetical protein n=1 Tax=Sphingomonas bacterium TaxID=1895847 RepID=UPI002628C479|nr:hypothetical protein [Sphingomonas bacterium]MDB5679271.1 hypothetical protein [Sphingomonas bacterium]
MKTMVMKVLAGAVALLAASPAMAQATRTWVSGVGDDVNPCSRTAPCKTFAGAISKTAAGGEINALDPGPYGAVSITKSITLRGDGEETGVLATLGTNGIIINAAATDKVIIDGLDLEGAGTGLNGIRILSARDVLIVNTAIRDFAAAGGSCVSINSGAQIRVVVRASVLFNCETGVSVASTGGVTAKAKVYNSLIHVAAVAGITVTGAGNSADIKNTEIVGTPKSLNLVSGGVVNSYGDNVLNGTATDAPTPIAKQ